MTKEILVVGGGPAGLTVARALVERGMGVVLVERNESLGGMARELTCKGLIECRNCGVCLATDAAEEILRSPVAEVLLLSEVTKVDREGGEFQARIRTSPRYVTDDCTGCGKCVEACPVKGKAVFPPTGSGRPRTHWIDKDKCLHFKKSKCQKCADICPTKAIDFEDRVRNVTRSVSSVVYASGIKPIEGCEVSRLGCGRFKDVISSVDAERILNEKGKIVRPSDGKTPKKVAIIQCVGSRSVKNGVEYCSKFCCKYATKIAQLLFDVDPEVNIDFYFMDLRTLYEPQDEFKAWAKAKKTVRLLRTMPAVVYETEGGKLSVRAASDTDLEVQENEYDLVVLSVGMRPEGASSVLASSLGLKADAAGFAAADGQLESAGVYVVGAVTAPMDIEETAVRATAIATKIAQGREGVL